jgi:hypothetical protein
MTFSIGSTFYFRHHVPFSIVRMGVELGRDVGGRDSRRFLGLRTNVDVEGRNRWKDHQHRIHGWSFRKWLLNHLETIALSGSL